LEKFIGVYPAPFLSIWTKMERGICKEKIKKILPRRNFASENQSYSNYWELILISLAKHPALLLRQLNRTIHYSKHFLNKGHKKVLQTFLSHLTIVKVGLGFCPYLCGKITAGEEIGGEVDD